MFLHIYVPDDLKEKYADYPEEGQPSSVKADQTTVAAAMIDSTSIRPLSPLKTITRWMDCPQYHRDNWFASLFSKNG